MLYDTQADYVLMNPKRIYFLWMKLKLVCYLRWWVVEFSLISKTDDSANAKRSMGNENVVGVNIANFRIVRVQESTIIYE